jgi:hypothetical protein
MSGELHQVQSTRRWQRHQVDLPIRIIALNGIRTAPVLARGNEISRAGMALRAPVALNPGDLIQLQFPTSKPSSVKAVVRNRTGECLGLEFLNQLPPDNEARDRSSSTSGSVLDGSPKRKLLRDSCEPQNLYAVLCRKQEELRQVNREIEALTLVILLMAHDGNDPPRLSVADRLEPDTRPWPLRP